MKYENDWIGGAWMHVNFMSQDRRMTTWYFLWNGQFYRFLFLLLTVNCNINDKHTLCDILSNKRPIKI